MRLTGRRVLLAVAGAPAVPCAASWKEHLGTSESSGRGFRAQRPCESSPFCFSLPPSPIYRVNSYFLSSALPDGLPLCELL